MQVVQIQYTPGSPGTLSASIDAPPPYTDAEHFVSILLLDESGVPLPIDYYRQTTVQTDGAGQITGVTLTVDEPLPPDFEAIVMTDAFPAHRQTFGSDS